MGIPVIWINRFDEERREGVPEPDFEAKDIMGMVKILSENGFFQIED